MPERTGAAPRSASPRGPRARRIRRLDVAPGTPVPLPAESLTWRCDPASLPFATTAEVDVVNPPPVHRRARDALRFAIQCDAPAQNVYVRGAIDALREQVVLDALDRLRPPPGPASDLVYVRNVRESHRPRLLVLRAGRARAFARAVRRLAEFVRGSAALRAGPIRGRTRRRDRAGALLEPRVARVRAAYPEPGVAEFLAEMAGEVLEDRFGRGRSRPDDPVMQYCVNVLLCHDAPRRARPVVVEDDPTPAKLLGTLAGDAGVDPDDHARLRPGAFVRASGGYLVLDASRLLASPAGWNAVVTTLRCGHATVHLPDRSSAALQPDPIPVRVRVILVGDRHDYRELDDRGPEFAHHFKVLADLDRDFDRGRRGLAAYAGAVARLAREEGLRPFDATAVAALVEHGARIVQRGGRITARLGRIADVAREAEHLAGRTGRPVVGASDVRRAVRRTKERARLDAMRFLEFVVDGTVLIDVRGSIVGQVNGLSVIHAGPVTYGFPARITASVGAGSDGILDVESRADLSGSIHTKGFHIFQGLLRRLLETDHPLAFTASLASEQTYGRVDGDSSSAAQLCCLLSALSRVPIRQSLATTGSIDQLGRVQAVGSVDEKIEGFYDVCRRVGLDGTQGVVIPRANAPDLMLREDVVAACRRGRFHVYAVDTIYELLTVLTGLRTTPPRRDGTYAPESLLALAVAGSRELWEETARRPSRPSRPSPAAARLERSASARRR